MALQPSGNAALPEGLRHFRERDIEWLENYLRRYGAKLAEGLPFATRVTSIANCIDSNPKSLRSVPSILATHRDAMVSEDHLEWIKAEDGRLLIWLLERALADLAKPQPSSRWSSDPPAAPPEMRQLAEIPSHERRRDLVKAIDSWGAPAPQKQEWLNVQKASWGQHVSYDKRYVKWLKKTDKKTGKELLDKNQLGWALEYLNNHNRLLNVPPAVSEEETYAIVTATIDGIGPPYPHSAEKVVFIDKMKKTWSQRKYRASGKSKKPYHLPLTVSTKAQLDWLAKKTGYRATDILAALIKQEHERVHGGARNVIDEKSGV